MIIAIKIVCRSLYTCYKVNTFVVVLMFNLKAKKLSVIDLTFLKMTKYKVK